jgi:8-oxo-dGTP pyrophosphatase MutT (NUDIX family)
MHADRDEENVVRAAGGIVTRTGSEGEVEILLVHRPRYDDWSLPKGKAERDESDEECALREVEEETSLLCDLNGEVAVTRYNDAKGRPKRVRYFAMTASPGAVAAPSNEVDDVRWLSPDHAVETLTYERDKAVVARFAAAASC